MIFVIGGRGRLGGALLRAAGAAGQALDRAQYQDWWRPDAGPAIRAFFSRHGAGSTIHVTAGVLDPSASAEDHLRVNFLLPRNIIESTRGLGVQVVTYGTVMETLMARPNGYVASKARLADAISAADRRDVLHLRLHTLYGGGAPAPFMFLGQMQEALRTGLPFRMTSGRQLREYHHVEDEASAIGRLLAARAHGLVDVSHGQPVSLRDLASSVFAAAGRPDLLLVDALPDPTEDNFGTRFDARPELAGQPFRSALAAVPEYLLALSTPQ